MGIIPSRYASSRFPGKPLLDLGGKSMIQRVYEQASKAPELSKVIVATDDERIYQHVRNFGGKALLTSAAHQTGTDRCAEVIQTLGDTYHVAVNIQGDEPFIHPEQISLLCQVFSNSAADIATLAIKSTQLSEYENPNRIKVTFDKHGKALYFSRSPIPYCKEDKTSPFSFYRHIGIYAYRTEVLQQLSKLSEGTLEKLERLEQLRWMENGYSIHLRETTWETPNIDTPEDYDEICKTYFRD